MARPNTYIKPAREKRPSIAHRVKTWCGYWKTSYTIGVAAIVTSMALGYGTWLINQQLTISEWSLASSSAHEPFRAQVQHSMKPFANQGFWQTRPSLIQAKLLRDIPDLQHVHVRRNLPNRIHLTLEPRQTIAIWSQENTSLLVDSQGFSYPSVQSQPPINIPILRVPEAQLSLGCSVLARIAQAYPQVYEKMSEMIRENGGWKINLRRGEQWFLRMDEPLAQIATIVDLLAQPRWKHHLWRVDIRLPHRWFIRPAHLEGMV